MRDERVLRIGVTGLLLGAMLTGCASDPWARSQPPAPLTFHMAADNQQPGWIPHQLGEDGPTIWYAPTASIGPDRVRSIAPVTDPAGLPAVVITLTNRGHSEMWTLSRLLIGNPMALLLDGRLLAAPRVQDRLGGEVFISGGDRGLPPSAVKLLLASYPRAEPPDDLVLGVPVAPTLDDDNPAATHSESQESRPAGPRRR